MEYYIQTRGEEADYCWVTADPATGQHKATPPSLAEIDSQTLSGTHFSLLLQWLAADQLFLVVKNLPSSRLDFRERLIRNTLVCLAPLSEEKLMRGITAAALEGQLEQVLNQVVQPNRSDPLGFSVNFAELSSQLDSFAASEAVLSEANPENAPYYTKDTQSSRSKLTKVLLKQSLPDYSQKFEPLILVSRNVEAAYFRASRVWWGLSERVDELASTTLPKTSTALSLNFLLTFVLALTFLTALIFVLIAAFSFGNH